MDAHLAGLLRTAAVGDPHDADRLAVALLRAGQLSFLDFLTPPETRYGNWGGPTFAGRYRLSIQAGYGKYSAPRQDGLAAADYSEWELAIVDLQAPEGQRFLVTVLDTPPFNTMPGRQHWEGEREVGPYVPVAVVQEIFSWMVRTFGAPSRPEPTPPEEEEAPE